jgi:hypothetical protein
MQLGEFMMKSTIRRSIQALLAACGMLLCSSAMAQRVYFEMGIAQLTTGYDVANDQSTIRKWYLAAVGPSSLEGALQDYVREAAEDALKTAAAAAYVTPGEVSAKIAAAWTVWAQEFPRQLSIKGAAKSVASKFTLAITENIILMPGLQVIAKAQNNQALMYQDLYNRLGTAAGGDVGKALKGYAEIEGKIAAVTEINIDIKAPKELTAGLARARELAPDVAARRLAELAGKIRLEKIDVKIPAIVPEVMKATKQVVQQIEASLHIFGDGLDAVLPQLPNGDTIKQLPQALGSAGEKIVQEAGKAATQVVPDAPPTLSDPEKCLKGDKDACCRVNPAICVIKIIPDIKLPDIKF